MPVLELDGGFFSDGGDACCNFCGAHHEECAELVAGPGCDICSECLVECGKRVQSYRDGLPAPERGAMHTMAALMQVAAWTLTRAPWCPWCKSLDVHAEFVDIGVGQQQVTPYSCGECLAHQFSGQVAKWEVTDEEWRYQWHCPPGAVNDDGMALINL